MYKNGAIRFIGLVVLISFILIAIHPLEVGEAVALTQGMESPMEPGTSLTANSSRLGEEIQISLPTTPECDRTLPVVAYNYIHDEYLVVWHNEWEDGRYDIYARRVTGSGELLSVFTISTGTYTRFYPAVVYNGVDDEYLVVWMYNINGDGYTYEIWGRTVAWNGASMDPEFQVITWENRTFWLPSVAWNSKHNQYLVVWEAYTVMPFAPSDVASAVFNADGNKISGAIITNSFYLEKMDVAYNVNADEYLLVWNNYDDIAGARLSILGQVITPPGVFTVAGGTNDQESPAVATNGRDRYFVVWAEDVSGDWNIRGQKLDANGSLVESVFSIGATTDAEQFPDIAAEDGLLSNYLVVWMRSTSTGYEEIWAYHRDKDDHIHVFRVTGGLGLLYEVPSVSWGTPTPLIVYQYRYKYETAWDPQYWHVYGRLWWPEALYLPLILR
ncbi:MAG: hypothetical protein JXR32_05175 [Anaerolineaceae bacterium]|nr:hypothetical protein [Anaerolineaceae bacterium]